MKQYLKSKKSQGGWSMVDAMAVIGLSGLIVAGILGAKTLATDSNQGQNLGTTVSDMASKIQKNYTLRGSYDTLTSTAAFGNGLVNSPLVWVSSSSKIQDPWGNVMAISGNAVGAAATFGITIGGATSPLSKANCTDIATQLASGADIINVGAAATVANGLVSGGTSYKAAGTVPDPAALGTACSVASPVIAVQWH
ncbi:hypothetical protein LPN04_31365 [Rugamonas sp. A1-17]|nr:hypothetical protein [Rugamonas sp. A1-17]